MGKKIINDKLFGQLRWSEYDVWEGSMKTSSPSPIARVWIESPSSSDPPTAAQRAAYQAFVDRGAELVTEIERALVRFYRKVRPTYCEDRDEDWIEENMPELTDSADIWRLLEHVRLDVPPQDGKTSVLGILANTSWDMEHGIQVTIKRGKVASVSLQGDEV